MTAPAVWLRNMSKASTRLEEAVRFAEKAHRGLFRDGPTPLPYVAHALEVMAILRYLGDETDEDCLCAAALHDTVEQSGAVPQAIEREFGKRVASLVLEL